MIDSLAQSIRPVAEPQVLKDIYTQDQCRRLHDVVRSTMPLRLNLAQNFASPDEVLATTSGSVPEGIALTWDMFLTPSYTSGLTSAGVSIYPEVDDCFHNPKFLDLVRRYWKAAYAVPDELRFNISGPCASLDPAHLDATEFRGITPMNTPIWLMNTMTKSGLFNAWRVKKAQVIAWFYNGPGGGFTYWPDGPLAPPKRLASPFRNSGVVAENEMMYHRGESNGPVDRQVPEGLTIDSLMEIDPNVPGGLQITTNGRVIQKIAREEIRLLIHWGAKIFMDIDEIRLVMDHKDDITVDRVIDIFISDLRARGKTFEVPTAPLHDRDFVRLLVSVYDPGLPRIYPAEAPGPRQQAA